MPIEIKDVLVADAVDLSCVELLKSNGISVDYKLKLPQNEFLDIVKVRDEIEDVSRLAGTPHWGIEEPSQN